MHIPLHAFFICPELLSLKRTQVMDRFHLTYSQLAFIEPNN